MSANAADRTVWRCSAANSCAAPVNVTPAATVAALGAARYETIVDSGAHTWLGTHGIPSIMADETGTLVNLGNPVANGRTYQLSDGLYTNGRYYLTWSYEGAGVTASEMISTIDGEYSSSATHPTADPSASRITR